MRTDKDNKKSRKYLLNFAGLFSLLLFANACAAQVESFDEFLPKFSNDSLFQMSRVSFPLKHVFLDDDTFERDSTTISKEDYRLNKLYYELYECSEAFPVLYDNFEGNVKDTNERVFQWKGFTGMDERYYFKRIEGEWFLVKTENIGT